MEDQRQRDIIREQEGSKSSENTQTGVASDAVINPDTSSASSASASTEFQAEISDVSESTVTTVGRDYIQQTFLSIEAYPGKRLKADKLHEWLAGGRLKPETPPPSPDAPLRKQIEHWFYTELKSDREKFFVLTLSLFDNLRYADIKYVYDTLIDHFCADDTNQEVDDPLRYEQIRVLARFPEPEDSLIDKARAQLVSSEGGQEQILKFQDEHYAVGIFELACERHPDILFEMLPALKQVVEQTRYAALRRQVAIAVAKIGKLDLWWIRSNVLGPWGSHEHQYVRSTVSYAAAYLVEDEQTRSDVLQMLIDWADPSWRESPWLWRYQWTVASACEAIALVNEDWAMHWSYEQLKELAGVDQRQVVNAVLQTLLFLSLQGQLERVLSTLGDWIEAGQADCHKNQEPQLRLKVAMEAFFNIAIAHTELILQEKEDISHFDLDFCDLFQRLGQNNTDQDKYYQLTVKVGIEAFACYRRGLYDKFFDLIAYWGQYAVDQHLSLDPLRRLCLEVYRNVEDRPKRHLINKLRKWIKQKKEKSLATAAIAMMEQIDVSNIPATTGRQTVIL
jgi:hypothetical protein